MSQSSLLHRSHSLMFGLIFPSTNRSWWTTDDAIISALKCARPIGRCWLGPTEPTKAVILEHLRDIVHLSVARTQLRVSPIARLDIVLITITVHFDDRKYCFIGLVSASSEYSFFSSSLSVFFWARARAKSTALSVLCQNFYSAHEQCGGAEHRSDE